MPQCSIRVVALARYITLTFSTAKTINSSTITYCFTNRKYRVCRYIFASDFHRVDVVWSSPTFVEIIIMTGQPYHEHITEHEHTLTGSQMRCTYRIFGHHLCSFIRWLEAPALVLVLSLYCVLITFSYRVLYILHSALEDIFTLPPSLPASLSFTLYWQGNAIKIFTQYIPMIII